MPVVALLLLVQTPPVRHLAAPDRVLPTSFTQIRGVVERPDGTVLVADRLAESVVIADFGTGTVRPVGRAGSGPAEYRLPSALVPWPGDSVLLVDEGNNRMALIAPDGRIGRTFHAATPGLDVGLNPRSVDRAGRHYAVVPGWVRFGQHLERDSLPLLRWVPGARRSEEIAWIHPSPEPGDPPRRDRPRFPITVFGAGDGWAAGPDGRVAVVRARDYHVDWIEPNGSKASGPPVPWTKLPVTQADRIASMRALLMNSGVGGKGGGDRPPGGLEATPQEMLTDKAVQEMIDNTAYASTKPPFTDAAPRIGSDGALWVERSVRLGQPAQWDVFDRAGQHRSSVILPAGRRLGGLGQGTVYLINTDADGNETLERYRLN